MSDTWQVSDYLHTVDVFATEVVRQHPTDRKAWKEAIRDRVEWSTWITSEYKYPEIVQDSPLAKEEDKENPSRELALDLMLKDVQNRCELIVVAFRPTKWKIRFVEGKRFANKADFDLKSEDETEYQFNSSTEADEFTKKLKESWGELGCPETELVAFGANGEEIPAGRALIDVF